eukprot:6239845-Pyramimonas_sp.AAC.1
MTRWVISCVPDQASAGAVEAMVDVLRTGSPADKTSAADVLANLSANSKYELAVMTAGAVGPLVDLLRSGSSAGKE